jgi:hypothetical protein
MKRVTLLAALCCALLASYVLLRSLDIYGKGEAFNRFTVYVALTEGVPPTIEWWFFRYWDFPTGTCEILFDVPMAWVGLVFMSLGLFSFLLWYELRSEPAGERLILP